MAVSLRPRNLGRWTVVWTLGVSWVACQPDWTELPVGGQERGTDTSVNGMDSGAAASTNHYGECSPTQVDALATYDQLIKQTGGEPVIVEQLYCVDALDTVEDCMTCDSGCELEILNFFSEAHRYDGWGYDLALECGPMWIGDRCCFVAQPMAWSE